MDTNLTTNLISEVTSMDKDLTTALISAGVSAGVSLTIALLYWVMEMYKKHWFKHKTFITYKNYVKEFFELYLHALKTNTVTYDNTTYNIDDLEFVFAIEEGNLFEEIPKDEIPSLILALISEREFLTDNETTFFVNILANLLPKKWILLCKKIDENNKQILFSQLGIYSSNTLLAYLDRNYYIYSPSSQDTIEKLQTQFKHKEFDERIKKLIKKNLDLLS